MAFNPGTSDAHIILCANATQAFRPIFNVKLSGFPVIKTAASTPRCPTAGTAIDRPGIGILLASPARNPVIGKSIPCSFSVTSRETLDPSGSHGNKLIDNPIVSLKFVELNVFVHSMTISNGPGSRQEHSVGSSSGRMCSQSEMSRNLSNLVIFLLLLLFWRLSSLVVVPSVLLLVVVAVWLNFASTTASPGPPTKRIADSKMYDEFTTARPRMVFCGAARRIINCE
mmetsp:Transcript_38109/g.92696  ORF Transcript_38109/g.92696 Transcript_38109/m.92696 type:complete len:227 (+) Transcript_38109:393-1073(+)